jgi:hypothetical protein
MAKRARPFRPDDAKLRELILLISSLSEGDPTFGAVKLNKLLFHCDFSAYLTYGRPITGQEYFALKQGPAPRRLLPITKSMQARKELAYQQTEYYGRIQQRPIALRKPNLQLFTAQEVALVDSIILKWRGKNATEVSDRSHLFIGWKVVGERETIPYSTALIGKRRPTAEERERGAALEDRAVEIARRRRAIS